MNTHAMTPAGCPSGRNGFLWLLSAVLSVAILHSPCLADDAATAALWKEVVEGSRRAAAAVESLQLRFSTRETFSAGMMPSRNFPLGIRSIQREIKRIDAGQRFREESVMRMQGPDNAGGELISVTQSIIAFDGEWVRERDGERGGFMIHALNPPHGGTVPPPHRILSFFAIDEFEKLLQDGTLRLVDASRVDLDGQRTIKVRFVLLETGYTLTCWFSGSQGYLMVRGEDADPTGRVVGLIQVSDVARLVDGNGSAHFQLLEGKRQMLAQGKPATEMQVSVDEGSIRINDRVDPTCFLLRSLPGEKIYDVDRKEWLHADPRQADIPENPYTTATISPATRPAGMNERSE